MNLSSFIGILFGAGIVIFGVLGVGNDRSVFLNSHAIAIVIGGTLAATLICFRGSTLLTLVRVFFRQVMGLKSDNYGQVIQEVVSLAKGYRNDTQFLSANVAKVRTPFLKEAIEMLVQGGIPGPQLEVILKRRALTHFKRYEEEADIFKVIAKFPPAFGLLGTTLGMIGLMQGMGSTSTAQAIGPAMAIGLTATFYGIAIANFIFIPMAENLQKMNREDEILREMVIDGIKLIREKQHPTIVEEHLKSYLLPGERGKLKKIAS